MNSLMGKPYQRYRKLLKLCKYRLSKFKEIFLSVATVATKGKLRENFLLRLKECALLYFAALIAFQDVATSVLK